MYFLSIKSRNSRTWLSTRPSMIDNPWPAHCQQVSLQLGNVLQGGIRAYSRQKLHLSFLAGLIVSHSDTRIPLEVPSRELEPQPLGVICLHRADVPKGLGVREDHHIRSEPHKRTVFLTQAVHVGTVVFLPRMVRKNQRGDGVEEGSRYVAQAVPLTNDWDYRS